MRRSCLSVFVCLLISVSSAFAQLNNDPDRIETTQGDLVVHPILHGTVIFEWDGKTIYIWTLGAQQTCMRVGQHLSHPHHSPPW